MNTSVADRLAALRTRHGAALLLNSFAPPAPDAQPLLADDDGIAWLQPDHALHRFFFAAATPAFITRAAQACPPGLPAVADIVTRADRHNPAVTDALAAGGFQPHSVFRRIRNAKLPVFCANERLDFARPDETDAVLALLHAHFDPLNSHFPARADLARWIDDRTVLASRGPAGEPLGLSVFHLQGRVCNYNYLLNRTTDLADAMSLLFNTYAELHRRGVTSALAWVDETNTGVLRMHQRFGYTPDGTVDYILVKP